MRSLLEEIRSCTVCKKFLPHKPRPILRAGIHSKIVIIGQAPGKKVQETGIPWDDPSGVELIRWLDITNEQFFDDKLFALIPMGFCYPGKGPSGDLPPRPECAPLWHPPIFSEMKNVKLKILVGQYAQRYYLNGNNKGSLTQNVKHLHNFLPEFFPLVHPSPRNKIWHKKNPWFELEIVPLLREMVKKIMTNN